MWRRVERRRRRAIADAAAVTAVGGGTPGDDGAVVFEREGEASGEELSDAGAELLLTALLSPPKEEDPR